MKQACGYGFRSFKPRPRDVIVNKYGRSISKSSDCVKCRALTTSSCDNKKYSAIFKNIEKSSRFDNRSKSYFKPGKNCKYSCNTDRKKGGK